MHFNEKAFIGDQGDTKKTKTHTTFKCVMCEDIAVIFE